ncbi:hypothetical protein H012_gp878 [Acanthamoeba polyphaga moumouvirus]|uniref:Uncharacterized protein n=2 Tax=Moumouvirus TaxID=3080801 RepID=L7RCC1_9VIRU|nr:hypothetical protein H012_gp878 [Acanthamoeba polyphaga moumouvirus]AEX63286.1 hypothetical protein mv_R1084 [Moumouvirus Monve]AGC01588.1 hypothetical protein Moumou_00040 [Acanthamoeba polyphaga moumouvirus]
MNNNIIFNIDAEYYTKIFDYEILISYKEQDNYQTKYYKNRINNYLPLEFTTNIPIGCKIENIVLVDHMNKKSYDYTIYDVTKEICLIFENENKYPYFKINGKFEYYDYHKKENKRCILF